MKNCVKGYACGNSCQPDSNLCWMGLIPSTGVDVSVVKKLAEGNYGEVYLTGRGTVVKRNKDGRSFGPYEVTVQKLMGEKGYSPKIISHSPQEIEMEQAKGSPIWKDYKRSEGEPEALPPKAQRKALEALTNLHRMGFIHGDQHVKQWILDPKTQDVKLIDFGLSKPRSEVQPRDFMIDFTKSKKFAKYEENSRVLGDLIERYVEASKIKNKAEREAAQNKIGQEYLDLLDAGVI